MRGERGSREGVGGCKRGKGDEGGVLVGVRGERGVGGCEVGSREGSSWV